MSGEYNGFSCDTGQNQTNIFSLKETKRIILDSEYKCRAALTLSPPMSPRDNDQYTRRKHTVSVVQVGDTRRMIQTLVFHFHYT
jgi:hypothetical protein